MNHRANIRGVYRFACLFVVLALAGFARMRVVTIGVDVYPGSSQTEPVPFANHDAARFQKYLGSALDGNAILLNTPAGATLPGVEFSLNAAFTQAEPGDTIYLFISSRGIARAGSDGYLGTADLVASKPESTGVPIQFLRSLIAHSNAAHVTIFADVNRETKDKIANLINLRIADLGAVPKPAVGGILATEPRQISQVDGQLGSPPDQTGYGLFGFYLVNAGAPAKVDVASLFSNVKVVERVTSGKQKPLSFGRNEAMAVPLARTLAGAPPRGRWYGIPLAALSIPGLPLMQVPVAALQLARIQEQLQSDAVPDPDAFAGTVMALSAQMSTDDWEQLRLSAINKLAGGAQRLVDRYGMQDLLPDDPLRVTGQEFQLAAREFRAAQTLVPQQTGYQQFHDMLEVRALLCQGLGGGPQAANALSQADSIAEKWRKSAPAAPGGIPEVGIPEVANATGIQYLEGQAKDYRRAIRQFQNAKAASPRWMYPRHNLALAYIENGDYADAEREYREAIALDSSVPYVYYNLGLLLHRMNRRGEAEAAYRKARDVYDASARDLRVRATQWETAGLSKDAQQARDRALVFEKNKAEVLNAWGALLATARNPEPAIMMYQQALHFNPKLCAAGDNLAQLEQSLAERKSEAPVSAAAINQLTDTLQQCPGYIPSLLKLGRLEVKSGKLDEAGAHFAAVQQQAKANTEALSGLASVAAARKQYSAAEGFLKDAIAIQAGGEGPAGPQPLLAFPDLYVDLAEVYRKSGNSAACHQTYELAIRASTGAVLHLSKRELQKRSNNCRQPGPSN
jgi:tetratricopeptide (TPR) repeat protein